MDAFTAKMEDRQLFREFHRSVKAALKTVDIGEMCVETSSDLTSYLLSTGGTIALKKYDATDMVFVGAASGLLPWEFEARHLNEFLKMCFVTKKPVFGCSSVAQFFAFYCVTTGIEIRPLNGPKGSSLEYMNAGNYAQQVRCHDKDVFLDNVNGDLYCFNKKIDAWAPHTNIGFRKRGATKQMSRFKQSKHVVGKANEMVCRITSEQTNHWLFKNINDRDMLLRSRPTWVLDCQSNNRSSNRYTVLGEGNSGPLIIEYDNTICIHADLANKYPETIKLIGNFVKYTVSKITHHNYIDFDSKVYVSYISQTKQGLGNVNEGRTNTDVNLTKVESIVVKRAAGSDCTFNAAVPSRFSLARPKKESLQQNRQEFREPKTAYIRMTNFSNSVPLKVKAMQRDQKMISVSDVVYGDKFTIRNTLGISPGKSDTYSKTPESKSIFKRDESSAVAKEALRILKTNFVPTHNLRIYPAAGNAWTGRVRVSNKPPKLEEKSKYEEPTNEVARYDVNAVKVIGSSRSPFTNYREFHAREMQYNCNPSAFKSIHVHDPYTCEFDREREGYLEGKKSWVSKSQSFNNYVGVATKSKREEAHDQTLATGEEFAQLHIPVLQHQFRDEAKNTDAWMR